LCGKSTYPGETFLKALSVRHRLRELGFAGPSAVRDFQAAEGLVADGIFGPRTARALLGV
jgi:peptidoglycan hydrolase-like protein with peptidoglycan-binding domain